MSAVCPNCSRPQIEGLLCHGCTSTLEYELGDVAAIVAELDTTLAKQARIGGAGKGGLASERWSYSNAASLAADYLQNTLTTWVRDLTDDQWRPPLGARVVRRNPEAHAAGPFHYGSCGHDSCAVLRVHRRRAALPVAVACSRKLLGEIPVIRRHGDSAAIFDEITSAIRQARNAADTPANRTTFHVGPCPELDEAGAYCPGQVYAFIPTEDDRPGRMQCRADAEHRWTSIQFYRAGKRIHERARQLRDSA